MTSIRAFTKSWTKYEYWQIFSKQEKSATIDSDPVLQEIPDSYDSVYADSWSRIDSRKVS